MTYHISLNTDLRKNIFPGTFIALEGIDGSGKSSQIVPLKKYFEDLGRTVVTTKTPRKTEGILAAINHDLMQGTGIIPKAAYQYLFTADYIIQMEELVIPALKRGDVVITDRFHSWSSLAYGLWEITDTYDLSLAQAMLVTQGLFSPGYQLIVPDVTFFFNISIPTAISRIPKKIQATEFYEKEETLEKVKKGYEWLLKEFSELFVVIDAEASIEKVTEDVKGKLVTLQGLSPLPVKK